MKRFLSNNANKNNKNTLSFYQLLGVSPQASTKEIKSQYYKLCKKTHPDTGDQKASTNFFISLTEAYNTLKDPKLRREYDRQRAIVKYEATPTTSTKTSPSATFKSTEIPEKWTTPRNKESLQKEAAEREQEDKLDSSVRRNRFLILGAVTFGYLLSCFLR